MNKYTEVNAELAVSERKGKRLEEANEEKDGIIKEVLELADTLVKAQSLTGGQESREEIQERLKQMNARFASVDERKQIQDAEADERRRAVKFNSAMEIADDESGLSDTSRASYAEAAKQPARPEAYRTPPSTSYPSCLKQAAAERKKPDKRKKKKASKRRSKKETKRDPKELTFKEKKEKKKGGKSKSSRSGRNRHDDSSGRADGAPRSP